MNQIETELETAIATARDALARFREDPMTPSKRGGPRLSPWWRVYVQSSEVAARLAPTARTRQARAQHAVAV